MKTIHEFTEEIRRNSKHLSGSIAELSKPDVKITVHEINRSVLGPTVDDLAQDMMVENESGMVEVEFDNVLTVTIGRNLYKISVITTAFYWIAVQNTPDTNDTPGTSGYEEHLQNEVFNNSAEDVTE